MPLLERPETHPTSAGRVRGRRWEPRTAKPGEPTVVLLHGLNLSSDAVAPTGRLLGVHLVTLAPDLPGFGRSRHDEILTIPELGTHAAEWIEATGRAPVCLAGTSAGAQVAIEVALQRPDLVARLALVSPTVDPAARSVPRQLARWAREARLQSPGLRRVIRTGFRRAGLRRDLRTFLYALADRPEEKLPHLAVPALVVQGELDPIISPAWAEQVTALLPDARLEQVPEGPHALDHDAPGALSELLLAFARTSSHQREE